MFSKLKLWLEKEEESELAKILSVFQRVVNDLENYQSRLQDKMATNTDSIAALDKANDDLAKAHGKAYSVYLKLKELVQ